MLFSVKLEEELLEVTYSRLCSPTLLFKFFVCCAVRLFSFLTGVGAYYFTVQYLYFSKIMSELLGFSRSCWFFFPIILIMVFESFSLFFFFFSPKVFFLYLKYVVYILKLC